MLESPSECKKIGERLLKLPKELKFITLKRAFPLLLNHQKIKKSFYFIFKVLN